MKNKVINLILTIIEVIFFISLINILPFEKNISCFIPIISFAFIKTFAIKKSPTRKSIFVTFSSIILSIVFINIYPIIRTLIDLTRPIFEMPQHDVGLFVFYLQMLFIFNSIFGFFILIFFGFMVTSKKNSFYFLSILMILSIFLGLSYLPFIKNYLIVFPIIYVLFYYKFSKYLFYFTGKYLNKRFYI